MAGDERSRKVSIYAENELYVDAAEWTSGNVSIEGQDLRMEEEYEYFLTVPVEAVPLLKLALASRVEDDVLELLTEHGEALVRQGERSWLQLHDIPHNFFSYP